MEAGQSGLARRNTHHVITGLVPVIPIRKAPRSTKSG